jgi:hypothetical protein
MAELIGFGVFVGAQYHCRAESLAEAFSKDFRRLQEIGQSPLLTFSQPR